MTAVPEKPKKAPKKWLIRATFEAPYAIEARGVMECNSAPLAIKRFMTSPGVKEKLAKPGSSRLRRWHKAIVVIEPYKDAASTETESS